MKKCTACKMEKSLDRFSKDRSRHDGLQPSCKDCKKITSENWNEIHKQEQSEKRKIQYRLNPQPVLARSKEHYKNNPEKTFIAKIKHKYNLSFEEYLDMLKRQNYVCAICEKKETHIKNGKIQRLSIDHCHVTGMVRGLLCNSCNSAIGFLKENPDIAQRAKDYITENIVKTQF